MPRVTQPQALVGPGSARLTAAACRPTHRTLAPSVAAFSGKIRGRASFVTGPMTRVCFAANRLTGIIRPLPVKRTSLSSF